MPLTRAQRTAQGLAPPQAYSIDKPRRSRAKKIAAPRGYQSYTVGSTSVSAPIPKAPRTRNADSIKKMQATKAAKRAARIAENRRTGAQKRSATMQARRTTRIAANRSAGRAKAAATRQAKRSPNHFEPHKMPQSWKIARAQNRQHAHAQAQARQARREAAGGGFQRMTGNGPYIKAFYTTDKSMATHRAPAHIGAKGSAVRKRKMTTPGAPSVRPRRKYTTAGTPGYKKTPMSVLRVGATTGSTSFG